MLERLWKSNLHSGNTYPKYHSQGRHWYVLLQGEPGIHLLYTVKNREAGPKFIVHHPCRHTIHSGKTLQKQKRIQTLLYFHKGTVVAGWRANGLSVVEVSKDGACLKAIRAGVLNSPFTVLKIYLNYNNIWIHHSQWTPLELFNLSLLL